MKNDILATAVALSDHELLARIDALARSERATATELVAHLAALELRPSLYLAQGCGSLFDYCRQVLRLSEDAACTRIKAARACRSYPAILDLLASGTVSLTAVRMIGPHLTAANHEAVLARASHAALHQIKALVAELAPQPDVRSSVRKLPSAGGTVDSGAAWPSAQTAMLLSGLMEDGSRREVVVSALPIDLVATPGPPPELPTPAQDGLPGEGRAGVVTAVAAAPLPVYAVSQRPIVQPLSPGRYRLQCTIGQQTHDTLTRLQALLRREIPDGDPAAIIGQALELLLDKVEKAKLGLGTKPRRPETQRPTPASLPPKPSSGAYETRIRFERGLVWT